MSHIYAAFTAVAFRTPRTFDPQSGGAARHLHLFDDVPEGARPRAIARAVTCVQHRAVPPEMRETAFRVLHSAFPFGPNKRHICHRDECPCGKGHAETVEHTFEKCERSWRVWELVLAQWRIVTGETKVTTDHGRITLLGDRSCTWATEADEAEWAGLEEPWAILHKVTLHVLLEERNRDAAPRPGTRRTAAQLYNKIQSVAQRIVNMRWRDATAQRRRDGGRSIRRFRAQWEAPGLAVITADASEARLVLFMREEVRARWRRRATSAREFRSQQYAPPDTPPSDMIQIFIAGDADTRKKNKPPPPAGYGAVATEAGNEIFTIGGMIAAGRTPNVKTTTSNLADLVAFTRALQWALQNSRARGRPICIRYNSEYAARISTGAWKAKKHKAMAEEAQRAWAQLKSERGGRVWMRHVAKVEPLYLRACVLAAAGKHGTRTYAETVS